MKQFFDAQEFNGRLENLQAACEAFRFMERSSGAYEEAIEYMQLTFNDFLEVVNARRKLILKEERS